MQARDASTCSDAMFDTVSSRRFSAARWFTPTTPMFCDTHGTGSNPTSCVVAVTGSSSPQPSDTASTSA